MAPGSLRIIAALIGVAAGCAACTGPSLDAMRDRADRIAFFGREPADAVAACLSDRLAEVKAFGSTIVVERHDPGRITVYETMPNTVMSAFDIFPGEWRTRAEVSVRRHFYRGDMKPLYQEITRDCLSPT